MLSIDKLEDLFYDILQESHLMAIVDTLVSTCLKTYQTVCDIWGIKNPLPTSMNGVL